MDAPTTVSVGTSATLVATGGSIILQSTEGEFYVGGAGVTTSNGIRVALRQLFAFNLKPGEEIYAVADSTTTVRKLRSA